MSLEVDQDDNGLILGASFRNIGYFHVQFSGLYFFKFLGGFIRAWNEHRKRFHQVQILKNITRVYHLKYETSSHKNKSTSG